MIRLYLLGACGRAWHFLSTRPARGSSFVSSMHMAHETLRELARAEGLIADLEREVRDRDERIDALVRERALAKACADASGSMMLDVQQECIAVVKERAKLREQLAAPGGPTTHAAEWRAWAKRLIGRDDLSNEELRRAIEDEDPLRKQIAALEDLLVRADERRFHLCTDAVYADVKHAQAALRDRVDAINAAKEARHA